MKRTDIRPAYYLLDLPDGSQVECIDLIEEFDLGFHLGSALKYIWRCRRKHETPQLDIDKAAFYTNRWLVIKHDDGTHLVARRYYAHGLITQMISHTSRCTSQQLRLLDIFLAEFVELMRGHVKADHVKH